MASFGIGMLILIALAAFVGGNFWRTIRIDNRRRIIVTNPAKAMQAFYRYAAFGARLVYTVDRAGKSFWIITYSR